MVEGSDKSRPPVAESADGARAALAVDAASAPAKMENGLKAGEGPYQALQRMHSDWDHKQLLSASRAILAQTGRSVFKIGESFEINEDGSVTARIESAKGTFNETVSKDGKVSSTRSGDSAGNFVVQTFDGDGKVAQVLEHKQGDNNTASETCFDGNGKKTASVAIDDKGTKTDIFDAAGNVVASARENNDGSGIGWKKNEDGSIVSVEQVDKNHRTEVISKDSKRISTTTTEITDAGKKVVVEDEKGVKTESFGLDGKKIAGETLNQDGSKETWKQWSDGRTSILKEADKEHWTETFYQGEKNIGKVVHEPTANGGWKETMTDASGKETPLVVHETLPNGSKETRFDVAGKESSSVVRQTLDSGVRETYEKAGVRTVVVRDDKNEALSQDTLNADHSGKGWKKLDGGLQLTYETDAGGNRREATLDAKGNVVGTAERDADGKHTVERTYKDGKVHVKETSPGILWGLFGDHVEESDVTGQPPKAADATSAPKPADAASAPKAADAASAPKPADAASAPKPADAASAPKPADAASAPKADTKVSAADAYVDPAVEIFGNLTIV